MALALTRICRVQDTHAMPQPQFCVQIAVKPNNLPSRPETSLLIVHSDVREHVCVVDAGCLSLSDNKSDFANSLTRKWKPEAQLQTVKPDVANFGSVMPTHTHRTPLHVLLRAVPPFVSAAGSRQECTGSSSKHSGPEAFNCSGSLGVGIWDLAAQGITVHDRRLWAGGVGVLTSLTTPMILVAVVVGA